MSILDLEIRPGQGVGPFELGALSTSIDARIPY